MKPKGGGENRRERLRILSCIKCMGFGGAEQLLVSSAQVRDRDRFEYETAYILPGYDALVPQLEAAGVPVHCIGYSDSNADLRWVTRLRRLVTERQIDIVHFHLPYAASIGRLAIRSLPRAVRPTTMSTEHNLWRTYPLPLRTLHSLTQPLDDAFIAVSQTVKESVAERHRARCEVVVQGIVLDSAKQDVDTRRTVRDELGIRPDEVLVGTVANLRPGKGYDVLLDAARQLLDRGLPVRFAAVGQGPLEPEVREQHRRLGLGDRFLLLGSRADALRVATSFDIFVLASRYEGFPVALMEALALGLPLVVTDVGGVAQAVTDGVEGLVVAPGRCGELVDALAELILDPAARRRMAVAASEKGQSFDITVSVRRVEKIYDRLAGR